MPRPEALTATSPASAGFAAPTAAELAGTFPELEILELLGQGGMGAVYKARQCGLDRLVALKILPPELGAEPTFYERFTREARALARLSHQNIVPVYDFGQIDGLYYFLMEYVEGTNLRQLMQTGALQPAQALAIIPQICVALQFAHDEGVIHRDIKPENILVDKRGQVKIADFGLAKLASTNQEDVSITGTHQVMGTLRYMAPEQMEGSRTVDHRADIYSLGVVFYELLTGEIPAGHFDPPSKKIDVDVRLDEVVLRALAREPDRRYQQASEVKTDVESITSGITARPGTEDPINREPVIDSSPHSGRDWVTLTRSQVEADRLPDCCIVCGEPTVERKNKDFEHTPDWAGILGLIGFFFGIIPGIVIWVLSTRKMRVACPICPKHRARWRQLIWFASTGWLAPPILGLLGFGAVYLLPGETTTAAIVMASVNAAIGLIVYIAVIIWLCQSSVDVEYITRDEIRLRKVSPVFAQRAAELASPTDWHGASRNSNSTAFHREFFGTLGRAWDDWWSDRDRWVATGAQIVMSIVFLASLLLFFNYRFSSQTISQQDGPPRRQAIVEYGSPTPWFRFETWPNETTAFQYHINYMSSATGIMLLGFLAWGVSWQIEKTKSKVTRKTLRWWQGSPGFAISVRGILVLCAVVWGMHPLYLGGSLPGEAAGQPGNEIGEMTN